MTQPIPHGVYAGYVWLEQTRYAAAIFVGPAITFHETDVQLEAHVLDAPAQLSQTKETTASVECLQWLRANQKFITPAALQQQIALDIKQVRLCLQALSKKS